MVSVLALSGANAPALPKGEPLAKPESLPHCQKPPSMREVASPSGLDGRSSYPNYSFSRTSCVSSLKEGAFGKTGKFAALSAA